MWKRKEKKSRVVDTIFKKSFRCMYRLMKGNVQLQL